MKINVIGVTGMIGSRVVAELEKPAHHGRRFTVAN